VLIQTILIVFLTSYRNIYKKSLKHWAKIDYIGIILLILSFGCSKMEHLPTRMAYYITFVKRSSYESFLQKSFPRKIPNLVFKIDFVDKERDL
jgi:hypothetical protein